MCVELRFTFVVCTGLVKCARSRCSAAGATCLTPGEEHFRDFPERILACATPGGGSTLSECLSGCALVAASQKCVIVVQLLLVSAFVQ